MKPTSARDVIRERTAYTGGRNCAHVMLALVYVGLVVGIVLAATINLPSGIERDFYVTIAASIGVAQSLVATILWFVAMAIFDTADCALANLQLESAL